MQSWLFPFSAITLWAGNVVVSKLAASAIAPPAITFYRLLLAVTLMSLFLALPTWRNRRILLDALPRLMFLGFLSMALYQCLSYWAADTSSATNMAIITALTPLLTLVASALILREAASGGIVAGGLIALCGTVWLISGGKPLQLLHGSLRMGDLLMLGAAASYACYSVLLKRWHIDLPTWQSTYVQAWSALLFMLPVFFWLPAQQARLNATTLPLILYAGMLASVLLPFLWIKGVEQLGPTYCSMFMNLLPLLTAGLAMPLLGEHLAMHHLAGGGITILGVLIAQRSPTRQRHGGLDGR